MRYRVVSGFGPHRRAQAVLDEYTPESPHDASAVYTGTVSVAPMETATFESNTVPFYAADVLMGAGFVEQGYGRILAEHENIICTAQTTDADNPPLPGALTYLCTSDRSRTDFCRRY